MSTKPASPPARPAPARERRGHGRVSLEDVAALAGVTSMTVSRFLREPGKVASATRERIREAIQRTGYLPNLQAGRLASGSSAAWRPSGAASLRAAAGGSAGTNAGKSAGISAGKGASTSGALAGSSRGSSQSSSQGGANAASGRAAAAAMVALLIPNIANSIFAETVQGLSDGLHGSGHELLLASTNYSIEREEEQLRVLLGWLPSAIVVTGRRHTPGSLKLLRAAQDSATPVIEIWDHHITRSSAAGGFAQIGFDHRAVGRAMAEHLLDRGCKRLAYVDSGVAEDFRAHERGAGFQAAARARGAQVQLVAAPAGDPFDAGRASLDTLLRGTARTRVDAAAFANDPLACGALLEAQARGVDVPGQLALLGFGDFALGRQLRPALSSVRPPRYEIGQQAARALLAALRDGQPPRHCSLPWVIEARAST